MEKVWDELKRIEAQAEQIRSEAQIKGKALFDLSHEEAEKLIANSQTYAEEEAKKLHTSTIAEANRSRDEQLKTNKLESERLKAQAKKRIEQATSVVVEAVLGETKL
jgi:hypothetical protein